ncbi:unnamed protein product, partial [Vitis vinifera]
MRAMVLLISLVLPREMRFHCRRHWIWFTRTLMNMWLFCSMHLGVLSLELVDQPFPFFLPCIPPCPTSQLKNQLSDQAYSQNMEFMDFLLFSFSILLCVYVIMAPGLLVPSSLSMVMLLV